jgi:O-antigen/teichoic acid export membrane protein
MGSAVRGLVGRVSRTSFLRGVAVISAGSLVAQALPVLLTPVLTRLYNPTDMGTLALYLSFAGFLVGVMTLGYALAIVSAASDEDAARLGLLSATLAIPVATVATVALWLLRREGVLGFGELPAPAVPAMLVSLVLTDLFLTLRYWAIRQSEFADVSRAVVAQSAGRMGTQLAAGLIRPAWGGLVLGEVVGRALGMRRLWREAGPAMRRGAWPPQLDRLRETAARYRQFPLYSTPSTMIDNLALMLPVPLATAMFGVPAAGQYAIATRVLLVPMALVGASVADVFHNRIARHARESPDRARPFFLMVAAGLLGVGLVPMLVVVMAGEWLFPVVLGQEWELAGAIAAAIAPWALAALAVSPVSRVVFVYDGQRYKLVYDVLSLLVVLGTFRLGDSEGWSIVQTVTALAWAQAALYVVYFLLLLWIVSRPK